MLRLDGWVALVTGAATALGRAISIALAQSGADVAVSDKPEVSLDDTASEVEASGREVLKLGIDVRSIPQIRAGVQAVIDAFGRMDILVSNAGINRPMHGPEVTEAEWDDHFNTNVKGGFFIGHAAAERMNIAEVRSSAGQNVESSGDTISCKDLTNPVDLVVKFGAARP